MSNFDPDQNPYAAPSGDGRDVVDARAFAELQTRLLGPIEILGLALRVFATRPLFFIGIVVIVGLPINILSDKLGEGDDESMAAMLRSLRTTAWLDTIFGVASSLGIAKMTAVVVQAESASSGEVVVHTLRRLLAGIGTRVMFAIACGFLTCLFIIPGIAYAVFWSFHDPIVSLRGIGGTRALAYSKRLVTGRWWQVFGVLLAMGMLVLLVMSVAAFASALVLEFVGETFALNLVSSAVLDVILSVVTIGVTIYFLNLDYFASRNDEAAPGV
jgi:hypothetical protein